MNVKYLLLIVFTFILTSCQPSFSDITYSTTTDNSSFLFSKKDANNLTFIERFKIYNEIIQSSPIPVIIADQNSLPEKIIKSLKDKFTIVYGLYIADANDILWPKEYIFINKKYSIETQLTTFFHESQHYRCRITKCYCHSKSVFLEDEKIIATILKEKHALENELRMALEMKDPYLIENSILLMINYILNYDNQIYKIASLCVLDGSYWKKSIKFLKEWKEKNTIKADIILLE